MHRNQPVINGLIQVVASAKSNPPVKLVVLISISKIDNGDAVIYFMNIKSLGFGGALLYTVFKHK